MSCENKDCCVSGCECKTEAKEVQKDTSKKSSFLCACKSAGSSVALNVGLHLLTCVALPVGLTMVGATAAAGAIGGLTMGATALISAGVASAVLGGWYLAKYRKRRPVEKAVFLASALTLTAGSAYFNTTETAHKMHNSIRAAFNIEGGHDHHHHQGHKPAMDECDPMNWCGSLPAHCKEKQQHNHHSMNH